VGAVEAYAQNVENMCCLEIDEVECSQYSDKLLSCSRRSYLFHLLLSRTHILTGRRKVKIILCGLDPTSRSSVLQQGSV
jgi:hypothetical protein